MATQKIRYWVAATSPEMYTSAGEVGDNVEAVRRCSLTLLTVGRTDDDDSKAAQDTDPLDDIVTATTSSVFGLVAEAVTIADVMTGAGAPVGAYVGAVGIAVGESVGTGVGDDVGNGVGIAEGSDDGAKVGSAVGTAVGSAVGKADGS